MSWKEVPFPKRIRSFVKDNYTLTTYVAYANNNLNNIMIESHDGKTQVMVQLTSAEVKESYGIDI
jgi:hypothetical protein